MNNAVDNITIELPLSKSFFNRVLIINKLYSNEKLSIPDNSPDDTTLLYNILNDTSLNEYYCHNAGTVVRFLLSFFACRTAEFKEVTITGSSRMQLRPIAPLADALTQLGASVRYEDKTGFLPITITKPVDLSSKEVHIHDTISSQYITSLMMIGPKFIDGLKIHYNNIPSFEYITMTSGIMNSLRLTNSISNNCITINHNDKEIDISTIKIERDWSSAASWFPIALIYPHTEFTFKDLHFGSLQGDEKIRIIAELFDIESKDTIEGVKIQRTAQVEKATKAYNKHRIINIIDNPDLAPTISALSALSEGTTIMEGISNLKWKESDRISGIVDNLRKINVEVEHDDNKMVIFSKKGIENIRNIDKSIKLQSFQDHRIAMLCIPFHLINNNVTIDDITCISKSYPEFINQIRINLVPLQDKL